MTCTHPQSDKTKEEEDWDLVVLLAWSALSLPRQAIHKGAINCLQNMAPPRMFQCLDSEERKILRIATADFFAADTEVLEHGKEAGLCAKTFDELQEGWCELFKRRRTVQPDDTVPIMDEEARAKIHNDWQNEWLQENIRPDQRKKTGSKQTSIWDAHLKKVYGGKHFVMALLETGIVWEPSLKDVQEKAVDAVEHVGRCFCGWLRSVLNAIDKDKKEDETVQARRRSGNTSGQHGLTPQEEADRTERHRARRDLYLTIELSKEYKAKS